MLQWQCFGVNKIESARILPIWPSAKFKTQNKEQKVVRFEWFLKQYKKTQISQPEYPSINDYLLGDWLLQGLTNTQLHSLNTAVSDVIKLAESMTNAAAKYK